MIESSLPMGVKQGEGIQMKGAYQRETTVIYNKVYLTEARVDGRAPRRAGDTKQDSIQVFSLFVRVAALHCGQCVRHYCAGWPGRPLCCRCCAGTRPPLLTCRLGCLLESRWVIIDVSMTRFDVSLLEYLPLQFILVVLLATDTGAHVNIGLRVAFVGRL